MKSPAERYGIDKEYLRRCKQSTPKQRLDWLAAAWEFANMAKPKILSDEEGKWVRGKK